MNERSVREKSIEELAQERRLRDNLAQIKIKLIVMSGKGGVGKTTVAINLAYGLAMKGFMVGILDADIHGPNIAKMLGIEGERLRQSDYGIEPVTVLPRLKAVSLALIADFQDQPIIWRGPLKMITIRQFLSDVHWGKLDFLIVDSPPGTGDEPLSVCQLIPGIQGAIIVTTPQDVAILDSRKSVLFAQQLQVPVVGIIENMSRFICQQCGKAIDLFGSGGGEKAARDLGVPFLGTIPVEPDMVAAGDSGEPFIHFKKERATAKIMDGITDHIGRLCKR